MQLSWHSPYALIYRVSLPLSIAMERGQGVRFPLPFH
jgi:hypothetical protein